MRMAATADPQEIRRFTSAEVWKMVEIGLLGEDEPYELLDGQLRRVSPQDASHAGAVRRLTAILSRAYGERHDVGVQLPIGGIDDSIPEPDLSVTEPRALDAPHPRADEVLTLPGLDGQIAVQLIMPRPSHRADPQSRFASGAITVSEGK